MRHVIAVLLLSTFSWLIVKPVLPFLDYALNYEYISEVLCINKEEPELQCHGQCHLAAQLEEANEPNDPATPAAPTFELKEIVLYPFEASTSKVVFTKSSLSFLNTSEACLIAFHEVPSPPPKG